MQNAENLRVFKKRELQIRELQGLLVKRNLDDKIFTYLLLKLFNTNDYKKLAFQTPTVAHARPSGNNSLINMFYVLNKHFLNTNLHRGQS